MKTVADIPKEYKTQTEDGSIKIVIPKEDVYRNFSLFELNLSDGSQIASMHWQGETLSTGEVILQPAITPIFSGTYLSYDGQANFIGGNTPVIKPSDGSTFSISTNSMYYFNNSEFSETPEMDYALDLNNKSIRMNNVSIFNQYFSKGVMFDFRASMEGDLNNNGITANIVILASILTIN